MTEKKRKISILGTGNVGASVGFAAMIEGLASEILLVDINKEKAKGEALDLSQCAACLPSCKVWCGEYEDVAGSDIVVVTFGVGRKPGQSRLDLAKINIGILQSVMPTVAKIAPDALYIIVSNPVDLLTYATIKCTNLSVNQVIGTGAMLDTHRLSQAIAEYCGTDISNVGSYVLGEHGDSCMVPWSLCTVAGLPLREYMTKVMKVSDAEVEVELDNIYKGMVAAGSMVIKAKGATYYAIAVSVCKLIKALVSNTDTILPVSTMLNGEYGGNNICTGVPCKVGASGVKSVVKLPLTDDEAKLLKEKIDTLTGNYDALELRK